MKRAWKAVLAGLFVAAIALPASAEVGTAENFNSLTTAPEAPLTNANAGSIGWTYTADQGYRDVAVVANANTGLIQGNAIRMSNAVTDSSFGNWLFSKPLTEAATETGKQEFTAEFDVASATGLPQAGAQISVAPQTAGGARMSFVKFIDDGTVAGGIDVQFADYANDGVNGRQITIADDLSRTTSHHVKIVLDLIPGPHNDVAQVYIDSNTPRVPPTAGGFEGFFAPVDNPEVAVNKAKAGQTIPLKFKVQAEPATTWEDYYRFNCESNVPCPAQGEWTTRPVDSLIFQARGSTNNSLLEGKGFLFDNVQTSSTSALTLPGGTGGVVDPSVFGANPFTAQRIDCDTDADLDTIEVYTPGASGLTYNASTGIWHYNWQTKSAQAGNCVEMTLNLTGDFSLFKFVK